MQMVLNGFETFQEHTRFLCWQVTFNEHDALSLQPHGEGFCCSLNMFFFMTVYHTFKIRKRIITNLDIITVEQFMKIMHFCILPIRLQNFADIYRNIKTLWWIKPYNLSFSIFGVIRYCK